MSVARFFERVHTAVGRYLAVDRSTLEEHLDSVVIGVEYPHSSDRAATWSAELLVNQLARLYPRLCLFGESDGLADATAFVRRINPEVELSHDPARATAVVSLAPQGRAGSLMVGSRGWSAFLGTEAWVEHGAEPNIFAAGAAAALAVGAVFRRTVLEEEQAFGVPVHWNMLTHACSEDHADVIKPAIDLGRLLIAGVGAVGNAALWCLARCGGLTGEAWVIDPDEIELSNLQRYVLSTEADIGVGKTQLASMTLSNSGLRVHELAGRLGETDMPECIEHVLVTVDNIRGRRTAQALLPRLVVNGWTSETGLGASWHDFAEGIGCLSCIYHPTDAAPSQTQLVARSLGLEENRAAQLWVQPRATLEQADVERIATHLETSSEQLAGWIGKRLSDCYSAIVCGSAPVSFGRKEREEVVVPLVHQSVLAGVLAAAELVKRLDPMLCGLAPTDNTVALHNITRNPPTRRTQRRAQEAGCICGDPLYREVHREKWAVGGRLS